MEYHCAFFVKLSWLLGRGQLTEDSARSIITGETGFAHTRAVIKSAQVLFIPSHCAAAFVCRMVSARLDAHFEVVARDADLEILTHCQ
jgi:hypothetical protein